MASNIIARQHLYRWAAVTGEQGNDREVVYPVESLKQLLLELLSGSCKSQSIAKAMVRSALASAARLLSIFH